MGKEFIYKNGIRDNIVNIGDSPTYKGNNAINFWRRSGRNTIEIGDNFTCNNVKITFKGNGSKLIIGNNVRITADILIVGDNRTVIIGDNTTMQGVYILSRQTDVRIGANCMFSREIEVRSTDVHKIYDLESGEQINLPGDVAIGDSVWVAARAFISKGASIPNGCVVGGGSFVNKAFDVENAIIAGSPAKIVKRNIRWER